MTDDQRLTPESHVNSSRFIERHSLASEGNRLFDQLLVRVHWIHHESKADD